MDIGVIDERGGDNSKISHVLFKEMERLYRIEEKYNNMKKPEDYTEAEMNEILTLGAHEFAKELIKDFREADYTDLSFSGAKSCALVCVDVMLSYTKKRKSIMSKVGSEKAYTGKTRMCYDTFLQEVKYELQNLEDE